MHQFIRRDRLGQRFVGQHQAVAEHVGNEIYRVLRQDVAAAAQVGERAGALDEIDRRARTRAEGQELRQFVQAVPRRIARLMFSAGMLAAFASAMIVRSRGFMSGSPPPPRAATVNSLMMRVKIFPRLASRAPFLCLMDAHLE